MSRIHGIEHHYPTHINAILTIANRLRWHVANDLDIVAAHDLYYGCSLCEKAFGDWLGSLAGSNGIAGIDCAREFLMTWQQQQRTEASDDHDLPDEDQLD